MFDGLIHFSFEAGFLYYSVFGRTIATSEGFIPEMGMSLYLLCNFSSTQRFVTVKEYALADLRWAVADPTV
jgi:hypothetical protein